MSAPIPTNQNPTDFFNEKWTGAQTGINKLLVAIEQKAGMSPKDWWGYHDCVYHICIYPDDTAKLPDKLYPKIAECLTQFVSRQAERLLEKNKTATPEGLLKEYLYLYNNYCASAASIRKITTYMHRFYIPQHKNEVVGGVQVREVIPLSYVLWREKCFMPIKQQLLTAVLDIITNDRTGGKVDMTLVRTLLHSFDTEALGTDDKGFYEREFENVFLDKTQMFYVMEATEFIQSNGVHEYMKKAETRIEQEHANCKQYYLPQTENKLKNVLNDCLITKHMEPMQAAFAAMLAAEEFEAMKRLCFLLSRVADGLTNTAKTYENYIVRTTTETVLEPQKKKNPKEALEGAVTFMKDLIKVYKKWNEMTATCFNNQALFKTAVDKAFQILMNADTGKWNMSRLLTLFLDHVLKSKDKEISDDAAVDDVLESCVNLFGYLTDKDEFEAANRKSLARRLLNQTQHFQENWEKSFVAKIKAKHGDAFTRKLQGMFTDAQDETVQNQRLKFEAFLKKMPGYSDDDDGKIGGVDFKPMVLNDCFWPLAGGDKIPIIGLPPELSSCIEKYTVYYKKETNNRRLTWLFQHGSVQVLTGGKVKYDCTVTPLQACILLLFNTQKELKIQAIYNSLWSGDTVKQQLRSSASSSALVDIKLDETLIQCIHPLIDGAKVSPKEKLSLLACADENKLAMDTPVSVVENLPMIKRRKIAFPPKNAVSGAEKDAQEDKEVLQKEREFEIDAAIVRVLKTRNVVKWNDLQVQTVEALKHRFTPPVSMIKKRLESLIDRKFCERDDSDRNTIKYIA